MTGEAEKAGEADLPDRRMYRQGIRQEGEHEA